ncbi:ATP synthase F1 subunit epsilon [Coriobacteriia bacterium Es71-Z0120]|uniref:ATP synthase F1 subunit epsilon n=1 Tax=Parvivirga hydrogeniphila TaxID=2939460 RepID=UPI0022609860|nr:ATP synthase F1 subunit epsilon [Parvivirga hydrogeniphila]MCL4078779.1 ATP synthase F1 subunit epsilon [Parvivirga hydrogeniphila]
MAKTLLCEIVTPERILYTNEVEMVIAPTPDGEIGVLPLHAPLVTLVAPGELRVRYNDGKDVEWFAVSGGYLQVHEDKVIVLADDAAISSQIDVERARRAKALIEERMRELKERPADVAEEIASCVADLEWCEVQIRVAERRA